MRAAPTASALLAKPGHGRACAGFSRALVNPDRSDSVRVQASASDIVSDLDFYMLFNVSPEATQLELKAAYKILMREYHPDRWSPVDIDTTPTVTLLNEIYEVLSDDDKRASYDALAGFQLGAKNPFLDKTFERDQIFVDEVTCIGCGKCVRSCPQSFEIEESLYGRARVISQTAATIEEVQIAIETCPVDCIHWVSLPQLSLLESALSSMARVHVFIMQRGHGPPIGNVFEAGYRKFERRQALLTARAAEAKSNRGRVGQKVDWSGWTNQSYVYEETQATPTDPAQRRIANLAAAAARAARLWKLMNVNAQVSIKTIPASSSASLASVE